MASVTSRTAVYDAVARLTDPLGAVPVDALGPRLQRARERRRHPGALAQHAQANRSRRTRAGTTRQLVAACRHRSA